jgi:hypothetical protein
VTLSREQIDALEQLAREHKLGIYAGDGGSTDASTVSQRAQVKLPTDYRQHSVFAREVGAIIAKTNLLFRRDLMPVTLNAEIKRLDSMSGQNFRTWSERFIDFFKERRVEDATKRIPRTMNLDVALSVLESRDFLMQLPEIKRLNPARLPVFRKSGEIELLSAGFFAEQAIYTLDDGLTYDLSMTGAQGAEIFRDFFKEYPLDARSLAAQMSAMFTMFCSCMLGKGERPPSFIWTANSTRAGKTILAKFPIAALFGSAATRSLPRYDEARKVFDAIAMQAEIYVIFDNVRGKISGEEIEAFLTSSEWFARLLGQSTTFRVENVTLVFFTGNQISNSKDMEHRSIFIELLVEEADPRDRRFSRIIDDAFLGDPLRRSQMCSAMWAMLRAWDADGRPSAPNTLMGGFEGWSRLVRSFLTLVSATFLLRRILRAHPMKPRTCEC